MLVETASYPMAKVWKYGVVEENIHKVLCSKVSVRPENATVLS
jgi:hypothetical protein